MAEIEFALSDLALRSIMFECLDAAGIDGSLARDAAVEWIAGGEALGGERLD